MRKTANLFLILFLATAIISLISEISAVLGAEPLPELVIQLPWAGYAFCGLFLYFAYGFNCRLPVRLLLPAQLWLLWSLISYWPMELAFGSPYTLYAAITQLILAMVLMQVNRLINGQSHLLTQKQFSGPVFEGSRLLKFCLLNILVLPVLLFLALFSLAGHIIEDSSAGFVRLKPNGVYMTEKLYQRNGKQIQLMGMIHLARAQFYTDLNAAIPTNNTLILMEGVKDSQGLLNRQFNYGKMADFLGLTSQQTGHFQGRLIDDKTLRRQPPGFGTEVDLFPADIDLSRFEPETIKVLNALAQYVLNSEEPLEGYLEFSRWAQQNMDDNFDEMIMNDLLGKRNKHLLTYLPAALRRYDNLVIPWGALHMKELEQAILDREFELKYSKERLSIDFLLLPLGQLWGSLISLPAKLSSQH